MRTCSAALVVVLGVVIPCLQVRVAGGGGLVVAQVAVEILRYAEDDSSGEDGADLSESELERKRFGVVVMAAGVVFGGLFAFVVLISLARMTRARRRVLRLGQKNAPTEYVDAWSQYRLDDDGEKDSADSD